MPITDLNIESSNRVGRYTANTRLKAENLNSSVFGMATTFCQVIQAFSQARASVSINPNDTSFLGFDLDGISCTDGNPNVLKIEKVNPGILFYRNIPYIIPEIPDLTLNLSLDQGKAYGLAVVIQDMQLSGEKSLPVLDNSGLEVNVPVKTKATFPFKIFWDEITTDQSMIAPKVTSSNGRIYIFTVTRSSSLGSIGWQINHSCFKPPYILDIRNTYNGRGRKSGTIKDFLDEFPKDKQALFDKFEVGDVEFFHETGKPTSPDFPFIPLSAPLTVVDKLELPDFYEYLTSYKIPLKLYIDGWEWDALPFSGESEKAGTRFNDKTKGFNPYITPYGYNSIEDKLYEDGESAGKKGTFGKSTFRIYLSKSKLTAFNTITEYFLDNNILLSLLNDLPMHPVRFPDLSNLMLDNDPTTPLGTFTYDPTPEIKANRTDSVIPEKTVESNYFRIKESGKPQVLVKDLKFHKLKGIVGILNSDPNPTLIKKDSIGAIKNLMPEVLLKALGISEDGKGNRGLFITAYNGDEHSITETETHIIIEIDDFLYSNELESSLNFLSEQEWTTTPYYLEFYPYRLPQTPYFEKIPMNVPAHKQLYAPNPISLSMVDRALYKDELNNRFGGYTVEGSLNKDSSIYMGVDPLGEDENLLRSEPPILEWGNGKDKWNFFNSSAINQAFLPDRFGEDPFKNGNRIKFKSDSLRKETTHTLYEQGKTCGTFVLTNKTQNGIPLIPTKGLSYKEFNPLNGLKNKEILYGFELRNPILERTNRSNWWLLDGSHPDDSGSIEKKSLRAKIMYNQAIKFFIDSNSVAPSKLPFAQKNNKKTLFLTGHSQLGGCPKIGDRYGFGYNGTSLNITQKPEIYGAGSDKESLHGIILNMRHLKSPLNNKDTGTGRYDYLYYMPKVLRFHQEFSNFTFANKTAEGLKTDNLYSLLISRGLNKLFGFDNKTNATDGVSFPIGRNRISGQNNDLTKFQEYQFPRFGLFLNRKIWQYEGSEIYNILNDFKPLNTGVEFLYKIDNYVMVPLEFISNIMWDRMEHVHPNFGMYLRITPDAYNGDGTVSDAGKKQLYLWQFFGILPAWFHSNNAEITQLNYNEYLIPQVRPSNVFNATVQYPGWIIFGDEKLNGNICIPPVAFTNTLYPNQVTSRNIALVFLQSIFSSREAINGQSTLSIKLNEDKSKLLFPNDFFKYTESTLDGKYSELTWGLSEIAGVSLDLYKNLEDDFLIESMVSLYWEDIRGTWLHELYQDVGLRSLLEKKKIDESIGSIENIKTPILDGNSEYSMGDFSSLFMLGIDYSEEKIMRPGNRYAVYYPNSNSSGSYSMDDYINTYLNTKLSEQLKKTGDGEKYIKVEYYGDKPKIIKGSNNQIIDFPVRDWCYKVKSNSEKFFNFTTWIGYFRECVKTYATSNGVNGFDGLLSPHEQNTYGLVSGGGIIKGSSSKEYTDPYEILVNGIPNLVNQAPQPSPQGFISDDTIYGNTKGGNEWNNPKLNHPHKKGESFKREFQAIKSDGQSKLDKPVASSKMNGIGYIYIGKIESEIKSIIYRNK